MAERASVNQEIDTTDYSLGEEKYDPDNELLLETDDYESTDEETDETQKIREQIEETRQEMSETINALQEKLSFENISEQVTEQVSNKISDVFQKTRETVYENTLKTAGVLMNTANTINKSMQNSKIYNVAKENPLPLFLIALGAGLLLFKSKSNGSNHRLRSGNGRRNYDNGESQLTSALGKTRDKITDTASSAYENTTKFADNAYQSVKDSANKTYESVKESANKTYEKVSDLGSQAYDQYDYYIHENPLAVGAVALAAGVGIGMMLPTTKYEDNLMGETSRNLLNLAKDKTTETVQSLKSAAGHATETLKSAAGEAADTFKEEVAGAQDQAKQDQPKQQ